MPEASQASPVKALACPACGAPVPMRAAGYTVTVATNGNQQTITVTAGGTTMSSAHGVLSFTVNGGSVQQPALRPPPVSALPVPGYPKPYKG